MGGLPLFYGDLTMTTQVFKNVELVHIAFRVWSGSKKLDPSDLDRVDSSDLPSQDVAKLGVKYLIDKTHLKEINSIRYKADELCRKAGIRLMGAYAVPEASVPELLQDLTDLQSQFQDEVDHFLKHYDDRVEEWAAAHPEFASQIRLAKIPEEVVKHRFQACVTAYRVTASLVDNQRTIDGQSSELVDGLLGGLVRDIADYVDRCRHVERGEFRSTVRKTVRALAEKLRRFDFLDSNGGYSALADQFDATVAGTGKIEGEEYRDFCAVFSDLTSVPALQRRISELTHHRKVINDRAPIAKAVESLPDDPFGASKADQVSAPTKEIEPAPEPERVMEKAEPSVVPQSAGSSPAPTNLSW